MIVETAKQPKVGIIIPAFNEERRIAEVIAEALKYCPEVVVIDDGSSDQTAARAESAGAVVIRHPSNKGKGAALNTGFQYAAEQGCDAVITMDADGQHDTREIPKFIETYVQTEIPVLVGNRMGMAADMPPIRRWTNRFMSRLLSRMMKQNVPDSQCGFRLYQAGVLPFLSARSERFAAESESLLKLAERGIRIGNVPIGAVYRQEKSKINPFTDTIRFFMMLRQFKKRRKKEL